MKGILVNIFGGIMKCDIIAEGVVAAARETSLSVPLVVRLEGTNVEKGKEIMASSGLTIIPRDNLADAADKITKAVKEAAYMAVLVDKNTRVISQGFTGRRALSTPNRRWPTAPRVVGGVTPGKGGQDAPGPAGVRHRGGSQARTGGQRLGDLRPAAVRGRFHPGSHRRGN